MVPRLWAGTRHEQAGPCHGLDGKLAWKQSGEQGLMWLGEIKERLKNGGM